MIEEAKKAAVEAGELIVSYRGKEFGVKGKERLGDIVTEADLAAEKIILERLNKEFPKHNFISEEIGEIDNGSEYTWVVDPLDGTFAFTAGLDNFGTSIGLLQNRRSILGVINFPALNFLLWSEKGKGAYLNGNKIRVSNKKDLLKAVVGFDVPYIGSRAGALRKLVEPVADKVRYPPMLGCASLGAAYVAMGVYDAYLYTAHPWDYAAATIIIEEAGGKVTDHKGKTINLLEDWIDFFASNGHIHDKILSLINK